MARTPHLRDVPSEFLTWAGPRWRSDDARVPRWLADYAEYELVDFTIGVAPRPAPPPPLAEVTAQRALVFADPRVIVHLGWAVHLLPQDDLTAAPEERAVSLRVYRAAAHQTRFLDLSPLAAAILERLFVGSALAQAMVEACTSSGHPLDNAVLAGAAALLADLGERGVLLGLVPSTARATPRGPPPRPAQRSRRRSAARRARRGCSRASSSPTPSPA